MSEEYVPTVVSYLATIVGGARTALLERARKELVGEVVEEKPETAEAKAAPTEAAEAAATEGEAAPAPAPAPAAEPAAPAVPVPDPLRKARAEKLLAAFGEA